LSANTPSGGRSDADANAGRELHPVGPWQPPPGHSRADAVADVAADTAVDAVADAADAADAAADTAADAADAAASSREAGAAPGSVARAALVEVGSDGVAHKARLGLLNTKK